MKLRDDHGSTFLFIKFIILMVDKTETIVIDIGSFNIKAGLAGEHAPKVVIPTLIGKPKSVSALIGMD